MEQKSPTILSRPLIRHKPARAWAIFLLSTSLAVPHLLSGQIAADSGISSLDVALLGAIGGLLLAPGVLGIDPGTPVCLPCDPEDLPFFDRWAVASPRPAWDHLSTGLVLGLAAATWWGLSRSGPGARGKLVASMESAGLATAVSFLAQDLVGRHRPVLYTPEAVDLTDPASQLDSWPSGHTAVAFALATSYVLGRPGVSTPRAGRIAALAAAIVVGGLRVAAARHFPSDVVSGAAVGVGSALLVHAIRF